MRTRPHLRSGTTRSGTTRRRAATVATAALAAGVAAGLTVLTALAAVALGPAAAPAGAHDGDAVIELESHPAGLSIHYIVRVTWANDGHPAADATVTATAIGADGTQLTPVTLAPADSDGRYAGVLEYPAPGAWTVRITSIEPTGTLQQPQQIAPPPTTAADDGATDDTTDPGSDAGGGFAPADDGTGESDETSAAASGSDDSGSGMPVLLLVAAGAVVVIGAATAWNIIRRKGGTGEGTDGGPSSGGELGTEPGGDPGDGETASGDTPTREHGAPDRSTRDATTAP
jgi:hypothetical protein